MLLALGTHAHYRAGISGTVTDAQGSVVSDAKVTVTAKETGVSQQATTDANRVYSVTRLTPGLYTVTVEKPGFKQGVLDNVQVVADQMNPANLTLSGLDRTSRMSVRYLDRRESAATRSAVPGIPTWTQLSASRLACPP